MIFHFLLVALRGTVTQLRDASYQWNSFSPSNDLYYGAYGGQDAGGHDMPGPSGLNQGTYDWVSRPY